MRKYLKSFLEDFIQAIDELATDAATAINDSIFKDGPHQRPNNSNDIEVIDLSDF